MRTPARLCFLVAALAAAIGCAPSGSAPPEVLTGAWGGDHVALTLTDSAGTLEYDCAHGGIDGPVRLERTGRFEASGVHVREHGGPIRDDEVPDSLPARYIGELRSGRMILRVVVSSDTLGPFLLTRNGAPRLMKCL